MTIKKFKLLFFVSEDWYFCSHRISLAIAAQKLGYDVTVITRVRNHGNEIRKTGIKLISFEQNRLSINPFTLIYTILHLAYILYKEKPDMIHNVSIKQVILGACAAMLTKNKKIISAITGLGWISNEKHYKTRFLNNIVKYILKIVPLGKVIVQNKDDLQWVKDIGIKNDKIYLIKGSGVNTSKFKPNFNRLNKKVVVILAARMLWDKGIREFAQAAKFLIKSGIKAEFILVGAPDYSNPAAIPEKQLHKWVKAGYVKWLNFQKDISILLSNCDIACLPSYREGLPKFLIEACASGLPIVTTNVPGCRDLVIDKKNGFLVSPGEFRHLAHALEKLIQDKDLRLHMGKINRKLALNDFTLENVNTKVLNLYKNFSC